MNPKFTIKINEDTHQLFFKRENNSLLYLQNHKREDLKLKHLILFLQMPISEVIKFEMELIRFDAQVQYKLISLDNFLQTQKLNDFLAQMDNATSAKFQDTAFIKVSKAILDPEVVCSPGAIVHNHSSYSFFDNKDLRYKLSVLNCANPQLQGKLIFVSDPYSDFIINLSKNAENETSAQFFKINFLIDNEKLFEIMHSDDNQHRINLYNQIINNGLEEFQDENLLNKLKQEETIGPVIEKLILDFEIEKNVAPKNQENKVFKL